jgi:chromosome segregation ATPase
MTQILKRLEIIKSSIAIEEIEIIELQKAKLQSLSIDDDDVLHIIQSLEDEAYATAGTLIQNYLSKFSGVVAYVDGEIQGLKLELKSLESKLQELVEQKTEYLNDIEEFNREYNLHLGELVKDILNLKKEILYKKTIKQQKQKAKYQEDMQTFQESKETIDELKSTIGELEDALESIDEDDENYEELSKAYNELKEELEKLEDELEFQEEELEKAKEFIEDESIEQEYEEVKSHYEEFESEYEHIKESIENSLTLNDEEKKELKSLYKQAARLCHPDIVPDELKEKAHELMQRLNDAYSKKDISKVKEILHSLQNGTSFEVSSETIEDKELLRTKIKEYLKNIEAIKSEIEEIKEDETYQTIAELDDWDEYFEELRGGLEAEKERLEEEAREVLEQKEPLETTKVIKSQPPKKEKSQNEEEDYWNEIF